MSVKLGNILYLTQAQYDSLIQNGSITIGGIAYEWSDKDIYFVEDNIPDPPTTDGTYVLTVTVSSGVATYSWEVA